MKQIGFLAGEELKKIIRSRYLYVFVIVSILDIVAFISEYIDRSRSTLYSTGVQVPGQGISYLVNHEFGSFGVLVIYLLPLLFIASPIFSDEVVNKMVSQIRVTPNGRTLDTIVKSVLVLMIQLIWIMVCSILSTIAAFSMFDVGVSAVGNYIPEIVNCIINIALGCFGMDNIFLFVSSKMQNTVSAMAAGFATIVMPMFIEVDKLWTHLFPIIGMQAECLQKRSVEENLFVWSIYALTGIIFFIVNLNNRR